MKTLRELIPMIDRHIETTLLYRIIKKSDFVELHGEESGKVYDDLTKSKVGLIEIQKSGDRKRYGFTPCFGEGISCYMSNEDEWYVTSIVKHIDWDKMEFKTLNSTYKFKFQEIPWDTLCADLQLYVKEHESKNQETEE